MKVIFGILIALVAIGQPTQALLGAKLALLSALTGGGGRSSGAGWGSGGGYGSGGYNGGYNQGYYSGPVRTPVYYGSGGGSYGSGGGSYGSNEGYVYGRPSYQYDGGYSSGGEQVRVIKVIVPQQQQQFSSGGYSSGGYSSGWQPVPAPAPVIQPSTSYVTTQAVSAQPQIIQVLSAPSQPAPVQISQPAPRPVQVSSAQPISVALQPPPSGPSLQVPVSASQNVQSTVKTIKVIVDEPSWSSGAYSGHIPSQTYGAPSVSSVSSVQSVPSGWAQNGPAWGGSGWSSGGSGNWNNGFKSGGIWEKLGC